jgi:trk system potassium uptake protein TrkA
MKFLTKSKDEKYTIIVGCGRLGANLANTISDRGENVAIIDGNKKAFRKLAPSYDGDFRVGDATEINVLVDADIEKATTVVSVTNNDNTNIFISQLAREMFKIQHVIARLYDPDRECVYKEFGINTICPAVLSAKEIDKLLMDD